MHTTPHTSAREGRPRTRWTGLVATAMLAVSFPLAACGSGGAASATVPQIGSATASTTEAAAVIASSSSNSRVTVAYSQCMRKHGVPNFPDPNSKGAIELHSSSGNANSINPNSPQYRAAQKDCERLAPGGGTPAVQKHELAQALKFSACMRAHGVPDFPDPTVSNGQISFNGKPGLGRSPQFQPAQKACQSLLAA